MVKALEPRKVLYPAGRFTKGEVIDYYLRSRRRSCRTSGPPADPQALPERRRRPVLLREAVARAPAGLGADRAHLERAQGDRLQLAEDCATLVWLANLASLELHTSLSRADALERPTMLVFDLDPGRAGRHRRVLRGRARPARRCSTRLGLRASPRPPAPRGCRSTCRSTAEDVTYDARRSRSPRRSPSCSRRRSPSSSSPHDARRCAPGKVLVDWSQNDEHKTTVASTPCAPRSARRSRRRSTWDEVRGRPRRGRPGALVFDTDAVLERVAERGDLFAPTAERRAAAAEAVDRRPPPARGLLG